MKISCIIIEDEPLALERTQSYVLQVPFLQLLRTFDNCIDAISFLKDNKVGLLFLDIQIDGLTGIQLLEALDNRPDVIITTAFETYAIKRFELSVTDYLLKPFTFARFLQAVNRVYDDLNISGNADGKEFMFIKTEYRLEKVLFGDILFIKGMGDYRQIHTTTKKLMTLLSFKDFEQQLPVNRFCRVHKSYVVAINKIESIERERIRIGQELIPISETYKDTFFSLINVNLPAKLIG